MTQENNQNEVMAEDEISLLDLAIALGEEKRLILKITAAAAAVAIAYSLIATPIFTARTLIIPPQQQQSSAASALASLGALAGMAGAAAGIKSSDEMYVAFMQSERMLDGLIERFKLKDRYDVKTQADARKELKTLTKIASDKKTGLIEIQVDDKDPQFAADMANAYVEELRNLLGRLAVTDAQQRRMFYEQQIRRTQQTQAEAEVRLKEAKAQSGLQVSAVIAEADVKASAEMRAQIAAGEVQLEAMSRFATPQNPDFQRLSSRVSALRSQLAKIEQGGGEQEKYSSAQQDAVKAYREIKAQEAMMTVLLAQYESARVDEAKEGPLVQQIDPAQPPERKAKPKRALIVLVSGLAGLFIGVLAAFVRRAIRKAGEDEGTASQMSALKAAWAWKKG